MDLAGTPGSERRTSETRRRTPLRWRVATFVVVLVVGALALVSTTMAATLLPTSIAGAAATCNASPPAHISYHVAVTPWPSSPTETMVVSAVVVSGLGSGCDGLPASLLLSGNARRDPAAPATLFSTATSARDPCTQSKLSSPLTVKTGSIVLGLCARPGTKGSDVSIHDLTHLTLFVGGTQIGLTPVSSPASGSGSGGGPTGPRSLRIGAAVGTGLAFTGADIAAMTTGGLLIVLLGLFLLLISRRRRAQATGDTTP